MSRWSNSIRSRDRRRKWLCLWKKHLKEEETHNNTLLAIRQQIQTLKDNRAKVMDQIKELTRDMDPPSPVESDQEADMDGVETEVMAEPPQETRINWAEAMEAETVVADSQGFQLVSKGKRVPKAQATPLTKGEKVKGPPPAETLTVSQLAKSSQDTASTLG